MLQGSLAAYLSVTDFHVFRSEAELGDGYADISVEPLLTPFAEAALRLDLALRY